MKKHLLFSVLAYAYFGFGTAIGMTGYDAGWNSNIVFGLQFLQ